MRWIGQRPTLTAVDMQIHLLGDGLPGGGSLRRRPGTEAVAPRTQVENVTNILLYRLSCATWSGNYDHIILDRESSRHVSRKVGNIPCLVRRQDHGADRPPLGARPDHRAPGPDRRRDPLRPRRSVSRGRPPGSGPLYGPTTRGGSPPPSAGLSNVYARLQRFRATSPGGSGLRHVVDRDVHRLMATMLDATRCEALAAVAFVSASPPPVFDHLLAAPTEACRCGCCSGRNNNLVGDLVKSLQSRGVDFRPLTDLHKGLICLTCSQPFNCASQTARVPGNSSSTRNSS